MPENVPKVAIITRTKDRGILLERAIKSVHQQTMPDFAHIIINDGGNEQVVNKLVGKYADLAKGRIRVIHNKESHGMEAASNKAIKSSKSTYIAIHDDDDSWHPDFLKLTTEHMDKTAAMGVVTSTDRIVEEITHDKVRVILKERWQPEAHEINLYKQCLDNYAATIAFIYRRSALKTVGYYDETLPVSADWDFAIRFLLQYDIDFLDNEPALANYHHRPQAHGPEGNSVFDGRLLHQYYTNLLRNKYLREDINAGKLGVGYIMNSLKHERDMVEAQRKYDDLQTVRLEGHINYVAEQARRNTTLSKYARVVHRLMHRA